MKGWDHSLMFARVAGRAWYAGRTLSKCMQMLTCTNARINFLPSRLPALNLLLSSLTAICRHRVSDGFPDSEHAEP